MTFQKKLQNPAPAPLSILVFVNKSIPVVLVIALALLLGAPVADAAQGTDDAPDPAPADDLPKVEGGGADPGPEDGSGTDDGETEGACDEGRNTDPDDGRADTAPPLIPGQGPEAPRATPQTGTPKSPTTAGDPDDTDDTDETGPPCEAGPPTPDPDTGTIPVPPGIPLDPDTLLGTLATQPDRDGPPRPDDHDTAGTAAARAQVLPAPAVDAENTWLVAATLGLGALTLLALWRAWGIVTATLARFVVTLGYRLDRAALLDHPVRKDLVAHLTARPGARMCDLVDACGVSYGRTAYHLRMLVREQVLRIRTIDGTKHYFPYVAPQVDEEQVRLQRLAHTRKVPGRILMLLQRAPGVSVSDIARALGLSPGHAHYHISRLRDHGLIRAVRQGRRSRHYMTDRGEDLLTTPALETA